MTEKRKHLHVCGENCQGLAPLDGSSETPPRMWRKHPPKGDTELHRRNTSTYVEKTDTVLIVFLS